MLSTFETDANGISHFQDLVSTWSRTPPQQHSLPTLTNKPLPKTGDCTIQVSALTPDRWVHHSWLGLIASVDVILAACIVPSGYGGRHVIGKLSPTPLSSPSTNSPKRHKPTHPNRNLPTPLRLFSLQPALLPPNLDLHSKFKPRTQYPRPRGQEAEMPGLSRRYVGSRLRATIFGELEMLVWCRDVRERDGGCSIWN